MTARKLLSAYTAFAVAIPIVPVAPAKTGTLPEASFTQKISKDLQPLHALNRLTFGARPVDIEQVRALGVAKWIEIQLHPERLAESAVLKERLKPLESLRLNTSELTSKYPPPQRIAAYATGRLKLPEDPDERALVEKLSDRYKQRIQNKQQDKDGPATPDRGVRQGARLDRLANIPVEMRRTMLLNIAPQQVVAHDLQEAKLYRAVYSERQLFEVLADFWFNHFNVYLDKGADRYLVTSYDRDAIRPHVLGNFQDMLLATARHPAMLWYLDNWQSVSPTAARKRRGQNRSRGLNENYARELLELHTLGVDGGYTQKDIIDVARCFTGWTIRQPYNGGDFFFNDRVHDNGEKLVLGVKIPVGGGEADGMKVLEILANHRSTARFVSRKLAQRFVADNPPEELVSAMAASFTKTNGDIRQVMRTLLKSKEFWSEAAYRSKVKSPFEMVASALRATGAELTSAFGLGVKIAEMGQPLYRKQEPTGYSNTGEEWISSAGLLARMNFALSLTQNQLPGVRIPDRTFEGPPGEIAQFLFVEPRPQTKEAIQKARAEGKPPQVIAALAIGSPEFQRR